jgi:hypothetical protein
MTRIWIAALLLLGACSVAKPEDATAFFAREAPSGPITVKAAANGDARVEAGDNVFIRRGGVDHVVLTDGAGTFSARIEDLLALIGEGQGQAAIGTKPHAQPEYALTAGASETVSGVKGTIWKAHPREIPSFTSAEAVIADDPALAALGKGLAMQTGFSIRRNGPPGGPGNLEKAMLDLFGKGLVLRYGRILRLERIEKGPIPAAAFELPLPVLDKAALKRRFEAERDRLGAIARPER